MDIDFTKEDNKLDENILAFLKDRGVKTISLYDEYKKGAKVLYFSEPNLILDYNNTSLYVYSENLSLKENKEKKEEFLNAFREIYNNPIYINSDSLMIKIAEEELATEVSKITDISDSTQLYNAMFKEDIQIPLNTDKDLEFRIVTMEDADLVFKTYTHSGDDSSYTDSRIKKGEIIGAFKGETLIGFVGTHDDGSMGLLEVLKEYRKDGIGKKLVYELIRRQRQKNRLAYGNIETWNEIAYGMYERMGFTIDDTVTTWLFK